MDSTTKITYGGPFAKPVETAAAAPANSETRYVGADAPNWAPTIKTSNGSEATEATTR
jgi:hypothetical protein